MSWFDKLSFPKWIDVISNGAGSSAQIDMRATQLPGRLDGPADAFRHILISAELARKYGPVYASAAMGFHEVNELGPGSAMDTYNNQVGYAIGQYVASLPNGGYGDVLRLTRELFQEAFSNETQPNATNNFTTSVDTNWNLEVEGYLTTPTSISLEGGNLILSGLAVLDYSTSGWKGTPEVNGQPIGVALSNWPDALGNWINNFVFDEVNTYIGDAPIDPGTGLPLDPVEAIISQLEILESGVIWTATTLEELAVEIGDLAESIGADVSQFVDQLSLLGGPIADPISAFATIFQQLQKLKFFDPVVLDMDGDGIELIHVNNSSTFFDFDKDGFNEKAGWVAPDDAFLVYDANGNGTIDDIDEMFGNETISGFDELASFDVNGDGKINASDIDPDPEDEISYNEYYDLDIWHDFDSDGATDAGELFSLSEADIIEIDITGIEVNKESKGNMITELSTWTDDQNNTFTAADVDFLLEPVNSIPQLDSSALEMAFRASVAPWSRGYGDVPSLQYAITESPWLLYLVEELEGLDPENFGLAYPLVETILYEWAGTTAVGTASRGTEWDGRKLATIEAFTGDAFTNAFNNGSDPLPGSKPFLDASWDHLLTLFQERLIVQGPMEDLFPNASYDFSTDSLELGDDSGTLIANAMSIETNRDMADYWFKFLDFIIEHDMKERDPIILENGQTLEEALEENGGEQIGLSTAPISCSPGTICVSLTGGSPWNTYTSQFTQGFAALIEDKLGFDLTDIDDDGNLDEEGWTLIRSGSSAPIIYTTGVAELSAKSIYHGPPGAIQDTNDFILGGKEDDLIRGYGGSDILYAGTGADYVYSGDGFNYMFGGAGADVLQSGENAVDVIYGNDGTDYVYLNGQDHTVSGGKGDDSINLDTDANATYLWGMADGNDLVVNSGTSGIGYIQRLVIEDDLTPVEIRLNAYGNHLTITNDLTDETFKVDGFEEELDEVHFSDGTVFDVLGGTIFRAHAFNDTYVDGWIGDDTMVSGAGADTLDGNAGNDVFRHGDGDGDDVYWAGDASFTDVVEMNGVDSVDLYFNASGYDLIATDIVNNESVTLKQQYYDTTAGYDFDTLSTHDRVFDITGGLTFQGTSPTLGEIVTGSANDDTIDGGAGNDMLYGLGGTDLFQFDLYDGEDHLYAGGVDDQDIVTIVGASASDLYYNVSSNGRDLIVTNIITEDQLTLDDQFYQTTNGYEFTSVNGDDVKASISNSIEIRGTDPEAGEYVYGTEYSDDLIAGHGNDYVYGQGGQDTFKHFVGDGNDQLYAGGLNDLDIVEFRGVDEDDLFFNVSNNDLIVTDASEGEQLTLRYQYYQTTSGYDFGSVRIDGASGDITIDITGGLDIKGTNASAGEFLYGTEFDDNMIGGAGNDIIYGREGVDTYIHDVGDGNDHLYAGGYDDGDIVLMNGVAAADLFFNVSYSDLVVTDNATGQKVTLDNQFHNTAAGYDFATVNGIDITGALHIRGDGNLNGTTFDDTLEGGTGTNIIKGGNGDDQLIASGGGDWLYGQVGDDTFVFTDVTQSTTASKTKIKDFVSGTDIIDLSAIATIDELSDLTLTENYGRTYVDDNNSTFYFEIEGSGATGLDASDFIFT